MAHPRRVLLIGFAGLLLGPGIFASEFPPARRTACEGCHAMTPQHASWRTGNHAKVACEQCHLPQGVSVRRAHAMTADGLRHGALTALGLTPPLIRLRGAGAEVVQRNCLRCHPRLAPKPADLPPGAPRPLLQPATSAHADSARGCADCHRETSHARRVGG